MDTKGRSQLGVQTQPHGLDATRGKRQHLHPFDPRSSLERALPIDDRPVPKHETGRPIPYLAPLRVDTSRPHDCFGDWLASTTGPTGTANLMIGVRMKLGVSIRRVPTLPASSSDSAGTCGR